MEDMVEMEIDLTGLVLPEKVEPIRTSEDGRVAELVVEPLERGYGHTLGNAVRRVLLSSLRGAAVWAFRTSGVVHEHQTIDGVAEDVHQVIQNLKALVVRLDDEVNEVTLEVKANKAGPVTAAQIQETSGVEVLDPDHHILTLQEDKEFQMELRVNKGRGFVLADEHPKASKAPVDLVRIDSVYNPVRRANFQVQETRVGQRTDFDQLTLHIETDGTIAPTEAVGTAAELVRRHMEYLLYFGKDTLPRAARKETGTPVPEQLKDLLDRKVEDLAELSIRSRNSLQKEQIDTLGQLISKTEEEMLGIENFGKKSLKEIEDFLSEHNLRFGMRVQEDDDGGLFFLKSEDRPGPVGPAETEED
jgi:DNA-directed RNA polymerase subunit alpha